MAYREPAEPPCVVCDRRPAQPCACCQRIVCGKHLAAKGEGEPGWCRRCADELYLWLNQSQNAIGGVPLILGLIPLAIGGLWWGSMIWVMLGYAGVAFPLDMHLKARRRRAKFITHVRTRGQLPARTEPPSEEDEELRRYEERMRLDREEQTRGDP